MSTRRRFRRDKYGVLRYDSKIAQVIIFRSKGTQLWAFAVWGAKLFKREGVEFSLAVARARASAALDELEKTS